MALFQDLDLAVHHLALQRPESPRGSDRPIEQVIPVCLFAQS